MIIRLILPICNKLFNNNEYYCYAAKCKHNNRLQILQNSMKYYSHNIDLVVTSNNFLMYNKCYSNALKKILNSISNKKNLVIGVDCLNDYNKFGGINAKILYFHHNENQYELKTTVWETYPCNNKALKRFKQQNNKRVFRLQNKSITLLSCGDIQSQCNRGLKGLPDEDIYIDLAHMNYPSLKRNNKPYCSFINKIFASENKVVLLTQQLTSCKQSKAHRIMTSQKKFNNKYFKTNDGRLKYQYCCPETLSQTVYLFNKNHKETSDISKVQYIFVDVTI